MGRSRSLLALGCVLIGFLVVTALRARPAGPERRLSARYRLGDLSEREERTTAGLRARVDDLRRQVDGLRAARAGLRRGADNREDELRGASLHAGLVEVRGPGLRVVLDDS